MNGIPGALLAALQERYDIGLPLGTGGMATVYRARDEKHGREGPLKVLHPENRSRMVFSTTLAAPRAAVLRAGSKGVIAPTAEVRGLRDDP